MKKKMRIFKSHPFYLCIKKKENHMKNIKSAFHTKLQIIKNNFSIKEYIASIIIIVVLLFSDAYVIIGLRDAIADTNIGWNIMQSRFLIIIFLIPMICSTLYYKREYTKLYCLIAKRLRIFYICFGINASFILVLHLRYVISGYWQIESFIDKYYTVVIIEDSLYAFYTLLVILYFIGYWIFEIKLFNRLINNDINSVQLKETISKSYIFSLVLGCWGSLLFFSRPYHITTNMWYYIVFHQKTFLHTQFCSLNTMSVLIGKKIKFCPPYLAPFITSSFAIDLLNNYASLIWDLDLPIGNLPLL